MKRILLFTFISITCLSMIYAVPAYRGWQTKSQPDGTTIQLRLVGDEFHHYWSDAEGNIVRQDANGYWRVVEATPSAETITARRKASPMLQSRPKRAIGDRNFAPRGLVILVNFKDSKFNNTNTASAMNDLMNSSNYTYNGATGSVRQYFSDQSDGQYTPEFDVIGPVTLPDYMAHYGGNDSQGSDKLPGDMIVEACSIANELHNVDFTQYDNDNDGYVDFVYVIYAGMGEADGGAKNTIWPHNWDLESAYYYDNCTYDRDERMFDGKYINNYACSAELDGQTGKRAGIGTITHEFSHVIGLPDLYDTTYGQNHENEATPGAWHIMNAGSYNNNGNTPPNYTIYDKYFLGWKTPVNPGNEPQLLTLQPAGTKEYNAYQITTGNTLLPYTSTTTAYYIENRQQSGWDAHLPGHGLVIWKVQYNDQAWANNGPNDDVLRYTIVSATGKTTQLGTDADPFPGTKNKTEWQDISSKPLLNITETNGVISLNYIEIPDETSWKYEVLYENATVSSEQGKVLKGGTLTLTVKPAYGYLLDETMIEVEENNATRDFTYTGTTLTINNVKGNLGIYIMPEVDPNAPEPPTTETTITGLKYADAVFVADEQLGDYWIFDLFADWNEVEEDYVYPDLYIMTNEAYGKTKINGTYNLYYAEYLPNADEAIYTDENAEYFVGTVTIKNTDNEGNYSFKGSFVSEDGNTYTFDQVVNVIAYAYSYNEDTGEESYEDLTLSENDTPDGSEDIYVKGLQYCDAFYYEEEGVNYYDFSICTEMGDAGMIYPGLYVSVEANSKTAINGTYNIEWGYYLASDIEWVAIDETKPATISIQHVDNAGHYKMKGSFVGIDGITYHFDNEVYVQAYDYDNDNADITLKEGGQGDDEPDEPEVNGSVVFVPGDFNALTSTAFEIEKYGITLACTSGSITADQFRFFKSQELTISSTAGTITQIEFACTADNDAKHGPGGFAEIDGYTYSGKTGIWTGNSESVTFSTTYNQVRATKVVVTISGNQGGTTGIENTQAENNVAKKVMRDGQILIHRNGKTYTIMGQEL